MRDGIKLRADILRPAGKGPFPALLYRTPYDKEQERQYSTFQRAVERGYAVVVQDVRGRYASEGEFRPYQQEGRDGYDTIEWIARRPWCNGAVGMFGLSYPAAAQWLAAVENPPHLRAMVPAMTFSSPRSFFYSGGVFDLSFIEWIWNEIAPDTRTRRHLTGPVNAEDALAAWDKEGAQMQGVLPLAKLNALGEVAPYYYEWLRHPPDDPWWAWADLRHRYAEVHAAVLNLSGWYDDSYGPEGATANFQGLKASRQGKAPTTALLVGPWFHDVDSIVRGVSGVRGVAKNAALDYDGLVLDWMDHYLREVDNGVERKQPVRYFVLGADIWREAADWPPPALRSVYTLGQAKPGKPGRLSTAPVGGPEWSAFVSDPERPVQNPVEDQGAHNFAALAARDDLLTFDSDPVAVDTEVTGPVDAHMFASCDCRDFDLWVRLYDVAPDGQVFNLMSPGLDVVRASYRDMDKGRQRLVPGRIYALHIHGPVTSNLFAKGHRIRVQTSGSFFPNFSRNLQTGDLESNSSKARKATIRIHHDRQHPSQIVLPIVPG
ncbi:MAG TPA: CocE/NonD family hydrolase [Polyangia bacterium]